MNSSEVAEYLRKMMKDVAGVSLTTVSPEWAGQVVEVLNERGEALSQELPPDVLDGAAALFTAMKSAMEILPDEDIGPLSGVIAANTIAGCCQAIINLVDLYELRENHNG